MLNYTTHAGIRARGPVSVRELCGLARWALLVAALVVGLLGMHSFTSHGVSAQGQGNLAAQPGHAAGPSAIHAVHAHDPAPAGAVCAPERAPAPAHTTHCTPAPGGIPPVPPGEVDLERSDALPQPPAASLPVAVRARVPAPDLTQLSISRT